MIVVPTKPNTRESFPASYAQKAVTTMNTNPSPSYIPPSPLECASTNLDVARKSFPQLSSLPNNENAEQLSAMLMPWAASAPERLWNCGEKWRRHSNSSLLKSMSSKCEWLRWSMNEPAGPYRYLQGNLQIWLCRWVALLITFGCFVLTTFTSLAQAS